MRDEVLAPPAFLLRTVPEFLFPPSQVAGVEQGGPHVVLPSPPGKSRPPHGVVCFNGCYAARLVRSSAPNVFLWGWDPSPSHSQGGARIEGE